MTWDCIIVGGGAAGLSAALVLGRARRRTLVIDAGGQSNLPAHGIGGLLGNDGTSPRDFYAKAREELGKYPSVEFRQGTVTTAEPGFDLDGERARTVLLASGMDYRFADLPGLQERWGDSVFHCPFCHGWEHRDQPLGVLDDPQRVPLLQRWSDDVTLYDASTIAEVRDGAVLLKDGTERPLGGLLVPVTLHQRTDLAEQLGATLAEPGMMAADAVAVDGMHRTSVPGLFAAGDNASERPSITGAIAAGAFAAAAIVHDLL